METLEEKQIFRRNEAVIKEKRKQIESSLAFLEQINEDAKKLNLKVCDALFINPRKYVITETKADQIGNGNSVSQDSILLASHYQQFVEKVLKNKSVDLGYFVIEDDSITINEEKFEAFERLNTIYLTPLQVEKAEFSQELADLLNRWNKGGLAKKFGFGEINNFETPLQHFAEIVVEVDSTNPWSFKPSIRFVKGN